VKHHCPDTPIILCGTKIDLRNSNPKSLGQKEGETLATKIKAVKYVECSAMTREGLKDVFDEAILAALYPPAPAAKTNKCLLL
jgi:cell division control protein 42